MQLQIAVAIISHHQTCALSDPAPPSVRGWGIAVAEAEADDRCANPRILFRSFHAPHPSKIPPN
jgi:hypothetical protein